MHDVSHASGMVALPVRHPERIWNKMQYSSPNVLQLFYVLSTRRLVILEKDSNVWVFKTRSHVPTGVLVHKFAVEKDSGRVTVAIGKRVSSTYLIDPPPGTST